MAWFERLMNTVADRGREMLGLREDAASDPLPGLCQRLVAGRGEATNIALAREILQRYEGLGESDRTAFLLALADDFGPDATAIRAAVADFESGQADALEHLLDVVEPPRQELFRRLNMAPQGTAGLVGMRSDLLARLREYPRLRSVDADFRHLLASWFNRGFLRLQRIDWHSPAALLEKIMRYESVHPIAGWGDLRRRMANDRRCFAFFHPALPEQPLIFVEVALVSEIAGEIGPLLDPQSPVADPHAADTAMFYSINNALAGLRGISFGNFLLKQVLNELAAELPQLKRFVTLSPVPRLSEGLGLLLDGEIPEWPLARLDGALTEFQAPLAEASGEQRPVTAVRRLLAEGRWQVPAMAAPLTRLTLLYITAMRRGNGVCCDRVAAFHLANGAILERINVDADRSEKGQAQSYGVMINYRYDPEQVVANHEAFVREQRIVMSRGLQREHDRHLTERD